MSSLLNDINNMRNTLTSCVNAPRKSEFNNCDPQSLCRSTLTPVCQGYPASIYCVRPLGNKSLMVYWIVHDFRGISGYEVRYAVKLNIL